jgi:hypothetical protein
MHLKLARAPDELRRKHPLIIEQLLALVAASKVDGVRMIIEMLSDLHSHGRESRFLVKMKGPFWELKSKTRGGERGGARVYLFLLPGDAAGVVTCEVKEDERPDADLLLLTARVAKAYKEGIDVFTEPDDDED